MTAPGIVLVLALMATATYLTRISGVWAVSRIAPSTRITRALDAMTGSVLIAIVAPPAVDGDVALRASIVVAVAVMLTTRKSLVAVIAGAIVAATIRII